jgi:hypothetical protein
MTCVRGCCPTQAEHYRSLSVQKPAAADRRRRDYALGADLVAYKALRRQGFQPPRIDGSYDLTRRATSEAEIRLGQVISDRDPALHRRGARLMEHMVEVSDHGMTGETPAKGGRRKRLPMRGKRPHDHG